MKQSNLKEYQDTHSHKGFKPMPRYDEFGDFLTHFAKPDRCQAKIIDEFLTIYISVEDDSVVGCKIKHVKEATDSGE